MATRRRIRYLVTAAVVTAAVVAALAVTPAGAHVSGGLNHLVKHLKRFFYTKKASDSRYLAATGVIRVNASPMAWVKINPAITEVPEAKPEVGGTTFGGSSSAVNDVPFAISPTLPTVLAGRQMELVAVNACYNNIAFTTLSRVRIEVTRNTNGAGNTTSPLIDETDRTGSDCRTYSLDSPIPLAPQDDVTLEFDVDYSQNAGFFFAGRATFILRATR